MQVEDDIASKFSISDRGCPSLACWVRGMFVLSKPVGWEVDTQDVGDARRLSDFFKVCLPFCQISYVLHRLDTPSSGLLLAAQCGEGLLELKWQLNTGALTREYAGTCHQAIRASLAVIAACVQHVRAAGPFQNSAAGVPAGRLAGTRVRCITCLKRLLPPLAECQPTD